MLTSRERIRRIFRREPVDRIGLFEVFWRETANRWADEGHIERPEAISDHFGLDLRRTGDEITPGSWKIVDMVANLDTGVQVVEEDESTKLVRDGNGALLRWRKIGSSTPEHFDFLVKERKDWEEHIRPFLVDTRNDERRIDFAHYRAAREKHAAENRFFCAGAVAVFDLMAPMCGHECLLAGMAMDPDWVRDMCSVYADTTIRLLEILFEREGTPDGMWYWDDLGFKQRPFMSPSMYRELLFPSHHRLFDFAHSCGLPVVLHCDGLVESLLPHLIGAGIDCLQPVEVKAGMDLVKLKKRFGEHIAFIGGMDVRELISNDLGRVRRELESKLPAVMEGSGYILQVDDSVPDQVEYDTYRYFVETGLSLGSYATA